MRQDPLHGYPGEIEGVVTAQRGQAFDLAISVDPHHVPGVDHAPVAERESAVPPVDGAVITQTETVVKDKGPERRLALVQRVGIERTGFTRAVPAENLDAVGNFQRVLNEREAPACIFLFANPAFTQTIAFSISKVFAFISRPPFLIIEHGGRYVIPKKRFFRGILLLFIRDRGCPYNAVGSDGMDKTELALRLLPPRYQDARCRALCAGAEELRLRVGQPLTLLRAGREEMIPGAPLGEEELRRTLEKATGASLHTAADSLAHGYIDCQGLRIGVCGTGVVQEGKLRGFRAFSSLALRLPRECRGVCEPLWRQMRAEGLENTLLLSPPGGGKTTALRDLIRCASEDGVRVGLVDERGEIAAVENGAPQYALGAHCDVLSGVSKAEGAMMLLRGMNVQLIAMDEITRESDMEAIRSVTGCGVAVWATAHAADEQDLRRRGVYRRMLEEGLFRACVVIHAGKEGRSYCWKRLGS